MLQYLLNMTAIWLMSLVLFDTCLRRESYHGYNRAYLLFTFLLGALLPLWQWQDSGNLYAPLERPIERVISTKQNIVEATAPATSIGWEQWLTGIYLLGVLVALCLLMADIIKLAVFYAGGKKSGQDNWTVIETGKSHAPFSFRNTLFVCSRQQYNADEWQMIAAHERRHTTLLHAADLLLMQAARIIFWFHPLVYVYNKRLLLVHEFQADNASAEQPQVYGRFLAEQALLQAAPSVTHSFNRSPIKNRIIMLTRTSTAASKVKMLVFIPLALVCIVCFSKNGFSQKFERKGNTVIYRGNKFEYSQDARIDTQVITDPITNKTMTRIIRFDPVPTKMNGIPIYGNYMNGGELSGLEPYAKNGSVEDYLFKNLADELDKLPDGAYTMSLNNVIVDTKGKIVYYEYNGITDNKNKLSPDIEKAIADKLDKLLNSVPAMKPAAIKQMTVIAISDIYLMRYTITVKDHKATVAKHF